MKKSMKALISVLMVVVMVCGIFGVGFTGFNFSIKASAEERTVKPAVSKDYWNYYSDGELVFTKDIPAISDGGNAPFSNFLNDISIISIDESNVKSIGAYGLKGIKVEVVFIPSSVTSVDSKAFLGSSITKVYYSGSKAAWEATGFQGTNVEVAFNHNHSKGLVKHSIPATCSKDGNEGDIYCSVCGSFYAHGEIIPKTLKHEWSNEFVTINEVNCSKDGIKAQKCKNCDAIREDNLLITPATGKHSWVVKDNDKFDDCSKHIDEQIVMHCENCAAVSTDEKFKDDEELKALTTISKDSVHHYSYYTEDPTCDKEGFTTVSCTYCKFTKTQDRVAALGHNSEEVYRIDPTCTTNGEEGTKCTRCGEIQSTRIIANLHSEGSRSAKYVVKKEASCVEDGMAVLVCNICGEEILENGNNLTKSLPKHPDVHTNSRWIKITEPTCTEPGEMIQICTTPKCRYHSENEIGKAIDKASDREALNAAIAVVKDTNKANYNYDSTIGTEDRIYDVADSIALKILAAYQKGDSSADASAIKDVFDTAMNHHGSLEANGTDSVFVNDNAKYVSEAANDSRYVYSEIIDKAVAAIVEDGNVILTADDIINYLENAWLELGDEDIAAAIAANPDQRASIINKAIDKKDIAKTEHKYTRVGDTVNCMNGGGQIVTQCEYCGDTQTKFIPEGDHVLVRTPHAPTCTENGYIVTTCANCDYYNEEESGFKTGHNYQEVTIKEASCSKNGITVKICQNCGTIDTKTYKTLPLAPHNDVNVRVDATCEEAGYTGSQCTVCQRLDVVEIPALGHDLKQSVVEPTCTEYGYTSTTCTRCDFNEISSIIPSPGHQYGPAKNVSATCTCGSYTIEVCTKCKFEKKTNVLDNPLGHHIVTDNAVPATCTGSGLTAGQHCDRPGCTYVPVAQTEIPATGHVETFVSEKAATCIENGHNAYFVCSVCGTYLSDYKSFPKTGHTEVPYTDVAPTCTVDGHTGGSYCSVCEAEITPAKIDKATNHTYGASVVTKEATAFANGTKTATCSKCGDKVNTTYSLTFLQKIGWCVKKVVSGVGSIFKGLLGL